MQTGTQIPLTRDLVLVGGGHAHALVLRAWAMRPLPGVRLSLINPDPVAPYTGMLPGHVGGHYPREALMIDLVRLVRFAGARLILDRATGLDPQAKLVQLAGRPPVAFDLASVDIGIGSGLPDLPGAGTHAVAAKPLGPYAVQWAAFLCTAKQSPGPARVVLVGGGVGGIELALAMAHRMRSEGLSGASVTVLEQSPAALPGVGKGARQALLRHCARLGVVLRCAVRPARFCADAVELADGARIPSEFTVLVAGARPQAWLAETGLALTDGFLAVSDTLQTSDPAILAAGDCAHMGFAPRPKAGVFAVRQAPVLLHNLKALASGDRLRRFRPQRDYLKLISTGGKAAVADKWGLPLEGAWLWRWKDRIDLRFMAMFHELPAMATPALPAQVARDVRAEVQETPPLCGGCGAKVAGGALKAGLVGLPAPRRQDVIVAGGDDAAVLAHAGDGVQVLTTDSLRAFTEDPYVLGRVAALHALGDVLAMGADPQAALAQITVPRASTVMQSRILSEIVQGASPVLAQTGADLVGGHTMQGDAMTVGFTLTGLATRYRLKSGARAGDVLILTRALGTGVILAAEMRYLRLAEGLLGEVVAQALASMQRPALGLAELAQEAAALTDITGFGLAGHLWEMLAASGLSAELDLAALPVLPGAKMLAAGGVRTHLAAANRAAVPVPLSDTALGVLLADPQTSGGFLAAVPPERAAKVLAGLHAAGEGDARIIGRLRAGPPDLLFLPAG